MKAAPGSHGIGAMLGRLLRALAIMALVPSACTPASGLEFQFQRRDPATGEPRIEPGSLDPARTGVVVVDMWNWHWCKTATARVSAMVPRMSHVVDEARRLGMTVFWCPSDVADNYVGTVPYERAVSTPLVQIPELGRLQCPAAPDGGGCTCGAERCQGNYGWDGMHPDLRLDDADYMPNDFETLYSICRQRGLTNLIYLGVHTQVCLLGKSIGLLNLTRAGFHCVLARDLTDAHARYDPSAGVTPESFTAEVVAHFEKHLAPTINFADELRRAGRWDPAWIVDPVRIAPWGTVQRPHFFEKGIIVTLAAPWQPDAELRYTLDGSEPGAGSARYTGPFQVGETTRLRVAGFARGQRVTLPSEAYFARLEPKPPKPQVMLGALVPLRVAGPGHSPSSKDHYFTAGSQAPQANRNNRGAPLRVRREEYASGVGVHAPNRMDYELKPEYGRFVALAGADDQIHADRHGANLGRYPSVVFRVRVDGRELAVSPVMRPGEPAWRFDVALPAGARRLSLITTDAGDGNREDLGDWVEAGFMVR